VVPVIRAATLAEMNAGSNLSLLRVFERVLLSVLIFPFVPPFSVIMRESVAKRNGRETAMQLNAPLVVVVRERDGSSGAVVLGITREATPGKGERGKLPKTCEYVREWRPGQTDHGSLKPIPKLVEYFPRKRSGEYQEKPVPALLCSSLKAAAEIFAWCEGYAKCAHCGSPFIPIRKDQTCCTPQHSALERVNRKRKRDAR
jgi:hypothetical protein